jgi:hypothetical protein
MPLEFEGVVFHKQENWEYVTVQHSMVRCLYANPENIYNYEQGDRVFQNLKSRVYRIP